MLTDPWDDHRDAGVRLDQKLEHPIKLRPNPVQFPLERDILLREVQQLQANCDRPP